MKRRRSDLGWYENLIRDIFKIAVVGIIVFWSVITFAGGGYFEAPVVNGKCRPFMEPPKPWKRMYQKDELRIRLQAKQIQQFQVLYCIEYDEVERGKIIREYVISEEWYVEHGRKN